LVNMAVAAEAEAVGKHLDGGEMLISQAAPQQ